jgi:AraC family transcriptional regulator
MKQLQTGEFYGQTNQTIDLDGIVLTDTEYTQDKVDWHYHENAYFTFILQGNVLEGNKNEIYHCAPGSLLFHNWQEAHYNIKPPGFTRGFHIELENTWLKQYSFDTTALQGSINISDPEARLLVYKIFRETKIRDDVSVLSVRSLLLQVLSQLFRDKEAKQGNEPLWVGKLKALLYDEFGKGHSLENLGKTLGIHPVHLSRYFPKYFHCGLGEYVRKLRVARSLALLSDKRMSLTETAFECGFADQSHFTRCFRNSMGVTPLAYKKLMLG